MVQLGSYTTSVGTNSREDDESYVLVAYMLARKRAAKAK